MFVRCSLLLNISHFQYTNQIKIAKLVNERLLRIDTFLMSFGR